MTVSSNDGPRSGSGWIAIAVVQGAAVLVVEIASARLLTPLFGQSLELWSVLISMTLAGLAAGYALGGYLAVWNRPTSLPLLLLAAAVACGIIAGGGAALLGPLSRQPSTLRMAAAAGIAVLPSMVSLGAVGPVLISRLGRGADAGATAGRVFAVSTVGSLVAGPMTGLYLLPFMGVRRTFGWTAAMLALVAVLSLHPRARRPMLILFAVVLYMLGPALLGDRDVPNVTGLTVLAARHAAQGRAVALEFRADDGEYFHCRRVLLVDGHVQSAVDPRTWTGPPGSYLDALVTLADLHEGDRAAVLGLGAGILPMTWASQGIAVEVAEPNPAVIELALTWFGLRPRNMRIHQVDGRQLVRTLNGTLDAIVVDAFHSSGVPAHMYTREAMEEAAAHLGPDGLWLAWLLELPGTAQPVIWPRIARTATAVFSSVHVYRQLTDQADAGALEGYIVVAGGAAKTASGTLVGFEEVPQGDVTRVCAFYPVQTDDRTDLDRFSGRLNAVSHVMIRQALSADVHHMLID